MNGVGNLRIEIINGKGVVCDRARVRYIYKMNDLGDVLELKSSVERMLLTDAEGMTEYDRVVVKCNGVCDYLYVNSLLLFKGNEGEDERLFRFLNSFCDRCKIEEEGEE